MDAYRKRNQDEQGSLVSQYRKRDPGELGDPLEYSPTPQRNWHQPGEEQCENRCNRDEQTDDETRSHRWMRYDFQEPWQAEQDDCNQPGKSGNTIKKYAFGRDAERCPGFDHPPDAHRVSTDE